MRSISSGHDLEESKEQQERQEADDYFKLYNWTSSGATWTELDRFLRSKGVTSSSKISKMFNIAVECGIIYKTSKRKYHYNGLNKQTPNDQSEQLPFPKPDP